MYENQEGYWRDLELVESILKLKPDIKSPENFSEPTTTAVVHDRIASTAENKSENKQDNVSSSTRAQVFRTKETKNGSKL